MSLSVTIGLSIGVAASLAMLAIWIALRSRLTPEKREHRRRLALQASGRIGDAMLTEVHDDTLYYTYMVRGVQYSASQDVGSLRDRLPADPERMIGMVGVKYAPKNPANSILLCEEWSGLRELTRKATAASAGSANGTASANGNGIGHQAQDPALTQGPQR
jgi:hypothetical protein